jgi:hypothetical protein
MFPDAPAANRSIFYREGRPATVSEVYANLTRTGGGGEIPAMPAPSAPDTDQGFVQYATGRRLERIQQQQELVALILRGPQDADDGFSLASNGGSSASRMTSSMFSSEMLRVLSDASDGGKSKR